MVTDVNTIVKRISQYPIVPQEAMMRSHGNIFPVTELNERLNQIDSNPNEYDDVYVGDLVQDNKTGEIRFALGGTAHRGLSYQGQQGHWSIGDIRDA